MIIYKHSRATVLHASFTYIYFCNFPSQFRRINKSLFIILECRSLWKDWNGERLHNTEGTGVQDTGGAGVSAAADEEEGAAGEDGAAAGCIFPVAGDWDVLRGRCSKQRN